jgi:hypothetical protein
MTTPAQPLPAATDVKAQAQQFQASQALLAALLIRDVIAIFAGLGLSNVRASWPPIEAAIAAMIKDRFQLSAILGQNFYRDMRQAAGAAGSFEASIPPLPSEARLLGSLQATGPYSLLRDIGGGKPLDQALQNSAVRVAGAAAYMALEGARTLVTEAVQEDPEALAWMRETTSGHPCAFCAMLAGRGAVYKSNRTASFEAHDHCACVAIPVWTRSAIKLLRDNDLALAWEKQTKGYSGAAARNAWRRYWDAQPGGPNAGRRSAA